MTATVFHARISIRDRGFALVIVLWALLLLSVFAAGFLLEARTTRTIANTAATQLTARTLADGAINRAIMALLDPRDPLRLSLDGASREIELFGQRIVLTCESEAGKIDLNSAPHQLLASLLRAEGAADEEADFIATQIESWRSPLRSSSGDAVLALYRDAGRSYGPRFGSFRSVGELRLVLGMTDALQEAVAPFLTVWSNNGTIDLSVANLGLLSLLASAGDNLASTQLAARQKGNAAGANRPAALAEALTIGASVGVSEVAIKRTASIQIAGDRNEPYRVLAWR
jgi:general secretion pathway protein K